MDVPEKGHPFFHILKEKGKNSLRFCELRKKEVINTCTCSSIGFPGDLDIDCENGRVRKLIVPGPGKLCGLLGRETEYVIPWECVRQIGEDIILVSIDAKNFLKNCGKS